jgi:hypothetical protein
MRSVVVGLLLTKILSSATFADVAFTKAGYACVNGKAFFPIGSTHTKLIELFGLI